MKGIASALAKILVGTVLFVGLPLVAWGLGDIPGFTSHPARVGYAVLMALLQIVIVIRFPGLGRSNSVGKKVVARQRVAVVLMQVLSLAIVLAGPFCDHRQLGVVSENVLLRYIGLALVGGGFILMCYAAAALGRQFSVQVTIQENHELITHGLFKYVRHPRYLGVMVFLLGIGMVFNSWWTLLLVVMMVTVLFWRIHDEEAFLRQEFGAKWDTYVANSWRLVPMVY